MEKAFEGADNEEYQVTLITSGVWTPPAAGNYKFELWGGGGGGSDVTNCFDGTKRIAIDGDSGEAERYHGNSGGSGGYLVFNQTVTVSPYPFIIGGGTTPDNIGSCGGSTSILDKTATGGMHGGSAGTGQRAAHGSPESADSSYGRGGGGARLTSSNYPSYYDRWPAVAGGNGAIRITRNKFE